MAQPGELLAVDQSDESSVMKLIRFEIHIQDLNRESHQSCIPMQRTSPKDPFNGTLPAARLCLKIAGTQTFRRTPRMIYRLHLI